jgi:YidC/Oxa1 family membrane protein insertase
MISTPIASIIALLPPVQWIVDLLHPVLLFFHDTVGVGWGMSIVLLTVAVRALLAPLTVKQFKSMQSMVRVAPQLKELQAKYKDDKQRQQQEVMKFYAENKINPFASCLPLVAQMPFFIGLFYLLRSDLRKDICGPAVREVSKLIPCADVPGAMTGTQDFLFIPDLTVKATGLVLAVLIVMYVSSQLLSTILTPSTGDRNQRMLMYALPFVFVIFVFSFPTGLILYWITTNLWTVGQGWILRRRMGPIAAPKGEPALAGIPGAAAAADSRGGGFMARMAAISNSASSAGDAKASKAGAKREPAATGATSGGGKSRAASKASGSASKSAPAKPAREGPPPPSPRKKKKRSGRRR